MKKRSKQTTIVIFGGTGDLTKRKLIPGLYNIAYHHEGEISVRVLAIGRRNLTSEAYFEMAVESVKTYARVPYDEACCLSLKSHIDYYQMDMEDRDSYRGLKAFLDQHDNDGNRLYYLATSAKFFEIIANNLAAHEMHHSENAWRRVVIEKPFGTDLETAKLLNQAIKEHFHEKEIFRIDHYLGKEMTQNILMLRGRNAVFQAVWNNQFIDHIQITVAEDMGVENRARYYDNSGAMRDMIQNHLLQIVALTCMPLCEVHDTEAIRDAKVQVFRSLKPFKDQLLYENVILAQYEGYKDIEDVPDTSQTESYVAMKLEIDMPQWQGVPIYLRTGKKLAKKEAYMMIQFKSGQMCRAGSEEPPNRLVIKIQPEEGVSFHFNVKEPGRHMHINTVEMDFCQTCQLTYNSPEAYESLLMDAIQGDQSRFTRWDEVESAWAFMDQVIRQGEDRSKWLETYKPGTWGPKSAETLIERDGRKWWSI